MHAKVLLFLGVSLLTLLEAAPVAGMSQDTLLLSEYFADFSRKPGPGGHGRWHFVPP